MTMIRILCCIFLASGVLSEAALAQASRDNERPHCFSTRDNLFIEGQPDLITISRKEAEQALNFCGKGYVVTDLVSHKERVFVQDPRDTWPAQYTPVYQSTFYVTCCSTLE